MGKSRDARFGYMMSPCSSLVRRGLLDFVILPLPHRPCSSLLLSSCPRAPPAPWGMPRHLAAHPPPATHPAAPALVFPAAEISARRGYQHGKVSRGPPDMQIIFMHPTTRSPEGHPAQKIHFIIPLILSPSVASQHAQCTPYPR